MAHPNHSDSPGLRTRELDEDPPFNAPDPALCAQLQKDVTDYEHSLSILQGKWKSTTDPTERQQLAEFMQYMEDQIRNARMAVLSAGCLGPPIAPACSQVFNTPSGTITITGVICQKWKDIGSLTNGDGQQIHTVLGNPVGATQYIFQPSQELIVQIFEGGMIIDVQGTDYPVVVYGAVYTYYTSLGGYDGFLGVPTEDERPSANGGLVAHFENGDIYRRADIGVHEVHGAIRDKFDALGGTSGFLGYPMTSESTTGDGAGGYNDFQGGSIYRTDATGVHEVHGAIRDKWLALGGGPAFLGYPITDETGTPDGVGRFNHFQRGSIYWTPETGAREIHGAIRDKWASMGWETSYLGYPVFDEGDWTDPKEGGPGRTSRFQHGSIIYLSNGANTFPVPDTFTLSAYPLNFPGPITGWAELTINSEGYFRYTTYFYCSSDVVSYHVAVVSALRFATKDGRVPTFGDDDHLGGIWLDHTHNREQIGFDQLLRDNFETLRQSGMETVTKVDMELNDVGVLILNILGAAGIVAIGSFLVWLFASGNAKACPYEEHQVADPTSPTGTRNEGGLPIVPGDQRCPRDQPG